MMIQINTISANLPPGYLLAVYPRTAAGLREGMQQEFAPDTAEYAELEEILEELE